MTQTERVLDYIREFGGITALDAMRDLGVMRLAARIADLRAAEYNIQTDMVDVKNRWGETVKIARYKEV